MVTSYGGIKVGNKSGKSKKVKGEMLNFVEQTYSNNRAKS
jgi:hypothetical protein